MKVCCEKFREAIGEPPSLAGGGGLYPEEMQPSGSIEYAGDAWHVPGCCGGGCYVLSDIKHCPFCGTRLENPQDAP